MKMIDLHTHFLPEIDDGAKNIDMSMEMLNDSFNQGVILCVSTSHCRLHHRDSIDSFIRRRSESAEEVKLKLSEKQPEIVLGAEVYLDHDISKYPGIERLCIGESRYMLTEFPHMRQDERTSEWIYELTMAGIKPIIAHIDRYPAWDKLIGEMTGADVLWQVNAEAFFSFRGRRLIDKLMRLGIDFIVSSDMHNVSTRACNMKKAYEKARKKYGYKADKFFYSNAAEIIGEMRTLK